jgi:hypothetical protein
VLNEKHGSGFGLLYTWWQGARRLMPAESSNTRFAESAPIAVEISARSLRQSSMRVSSADTPFDSTRRIYLRMINNNVFETRRHFRNVPIVKGKVKAICETNE